MGVPHFVTFSNCHCHRRKFVGMSLGQLRPAPPLAFNFFQLAAVALDADERMAGMGFWRANFSTCLIPTMIEKYGCSQAADSAARLGT
jgi:hypothetical protein